MNATPEAQAIADEVEAFVRERVIPFENDPRCTDHGPSDDLVTELRSLARDAGLLTPHIRSDGSHLSHLDTALVLRKSGLSTLGPVALNVMAPDEANMYMLAKICLLYTSPSPRDQRGSRMPSSA